MACWAQDDLVDVVGAGLEEAFGALEVTRRLLRLAVKQQDLGADEVPAGRLQAIF